MPVQIHRAARRGHRLTQSLLVLWVASIAHPALGACSADPPRKISVLVRGVNNEAAATAIGRSLKTVDGLTFDVDDIRPGTKRRYFTPPFVITAQAGQQDRIGRTAQVINRTKTPNRDDLPPRFNLVLFTDDTITEPLVMQVRAALKSVPGLEVEVSGGLGAFPQKGYFWIQLDDSGEAKLTEIAKAIKRHSLDLSWSRDGPSISDMPLPN